MDPVIETALRRHSGVFAAADALAAGMDRNAIAALVHSGDWRRVRYGVYTTRALWQEHAMAGSLHLLECAAVIRRLGRRQSVVSHASAARLHGLVVPESAGQGVWLTDPVQFRSGRGYRIRRAPVPQHEVVLLDRLSATAVPRTLADVGREWDVVDTVVAADDALADGRLSTADLTAAALGQTHWVGAGRAARAFSLARVGAHSPHETRTRLAFHAAGLPEPVLQAAVLVGNRLLAVLDMLWPDEGVFAECDGRIKYDEPWRGRSPAEVAWAEKRRQDDLMDLDLRGVRIAPADLFSPLPGKLARLRTLLAAPRPIARPHYRVEQWRGGVRMGRQPAAS
ncbi:hypothetical protein GB931_06360 [Modestobacter sp. I12A-02628]|uniref:Type IV toxin-antitoxin system AbiEi family antitoxin domain-containing protein n=1 Tax=Goekera deserti TaxID=2497753 RepID=A0A7K3WBA1_9ACTN|nr:type IV toxin-antitoxin system AbiEi family antitoxin domain-containing protein [Goekera deserti]MPQ97548.1 hypothetical protein [Goekera deserti]NDI47848.1 hypothetical protein [Goekera deserti]NEL53596.1 type IV toxin-antitoxin system AbiEi family antitoxin domain-containing protein [Goekera deserti]